MNRFERENRGTKTFTLDELFEADKWSRVVAKEVLGK